MSAIDKFKNIIKECLREVLNEEMGNPPSQKINESNIQKPKINTKPEIESTGNPILDILNETKQNLTSEDISNMVEGSSSPSPEYSNPHTGISENDIPDYSALMSKMNDK